MTCDQARLSLGVYVLGAIDATERHDVDRHLDACARCREELAELAMLPGLLGRLTEAEAAAISQPPPLESLAPREPLEPLTPPANVVPLRPRRRARWLAVAAAGVVLATGAGVGIAVVTNSGPGAAVASTAAGAPVQAQIRVSSHDWGSAVNVRLTGVRPGERCRLLAIDGSGHSEVAASWAANYEGDANVTGATAITASDLRQFQVVTAEGQVLATVTAPHTA